MTFFSRSVAVTVLTLVSALLTTASWLTFGGDPQRSGWAKNETIVTKDNVKSLQVEWKLHVENEAKELNYSHNASSD